MSDDLSLECSGEARPSLRRGQWVQARTYLAAGLGYLALATAGALPFDHQFYDRYPGYRW